MFRDKGIEQGGIVSHRFELLMQECDRRAPLRHGRVCLDPAGVIQVIIRFIDPEDQSEDPVVIPEPPPFQNLFIALVQAFVQTLGRYARRGYNNHHRL